MKVKGRQILIISLNTIFYCEINNNYYYYCPVLAHCCFLFMQESVLMLFIHIFRLYTLILTTFSSLSFCADSIDDQTAGFSAMECCIADIRHWMLHDKLKLNDNKTEFSFTGTCQQLLLAKVSFDTINIGSDVISSVAWDLGVWFDANLTMSTHIIFVPQPSSSYITFVTLGNSCLCLQQKIWFMPL